MQYELLDTTFYKSYYLLFVSRVDLLKDYHNNFVNQVANLDTVRYNEVLRYKQKVQNAINNFVSSKKLSVWQWILCLTMLDPWMSFIKRPLLILYLMKERN